MSFINWGGESPDQLALRKALEEQALFEQAARLSQARNRGTNIMFGGAGSGGTPTNTEFIMIVNTTETTTFDMSIEVTNDTSYTLVTGGLQGETITGVLTTGSNNITYNYVIDDAAFEARLTVANPGSVSAINIFNSRIMEFSNLQVFTNLLNFECDNNFLQSADFSGMSSLITIDISDSDLPATNFNCLTTVNLAGCTNLEELRLDDSDFSEGIPNLTGLNNLVWLRLDNCGITGSIDLSGLPSLNGFDLSGNVGLTNVIISSSQPLGGGGFNSIDLFDCGLPEENVDNILVTLSINGISGGDVNIEGENNAAPSEIGLAAKAVLEGNSWGVFVNLPPPGTATIAPSTDFNIVGDFTIEMFVKFSNLNGNPRPYSFGAYPTAANSVSFEGGTFYFWANSSGSPRSFGPFSPSIGQWYHICVMRSGTDISLFVDGNEIASYLYSDDIPSQGLPLTIGNGNESNSSLNGLVSNFRWTDAAVYTIGGFIAPSAPLTDLPDTKLLIFQGTSLNAQLTDNSGNGNNAFGSGSITYSTDDPFGSLEGSIQLGTV